jgi:hypothetical protein
VRVPHGRAQLVVEISFENEDDFIHTLACVQAETGLAMPVPAALITGRTLTVPALASSRPSAVPPAKEGAKSKQISPI